MLSSLVGELKQRWDNHFLVAGKGTSYTANKQQQQRSPSEQKRAIAHLLFNLVEVMPAPPGNQPRPRNLWEDPAYKRVVNVVGLQVLGKEIEQQARQYQAIVA